MEKKQNKAQQINAILRQIEEKYKIPNPIAAAGYFLVMLAELPHSFNKEGSAPFGMKGITNEPLVYETLKQGFKDMKRALDYRRNRDRN